MIQVTMKKMMILAAMTVVGQTQMLAVQDYNFGFGYEVEEHKDIRRSREEYIKYVEKNIPVGSNLDAHSFFDDKDVSQETELRLSQVLQNRISVELHKNVYKVLRTIGEKIEKKAGDYANSKSSDSDTRTKLKKELVQEAQVVLHKIAFGSSEWLNLIPLANAVGKEFTQLEVGDLDSALSNNEDILRVIGLDGDKGVAEKFINIINFNLLAYKQLFDYLYSGDSRSELNEHYATLLFKNAVGSYSARKIVTEDINVGEYLRDVNRQEKARQFIVSVDVKKKYELLQKFQDAVLNPEGARSSWLETVSNVSLPLLVVIAGYGAIAYSGKVKSESFMTPYQWAENNFTQLKKPVDVAG